MALHNLASLPQISVGGAVATATHGSGDRNGNLGDRGARLRAGDVERRGACGRSAAIPTSTALVVGLGALGVVTG